MDRPGSNVPAAARVIVVATRMGGNKDNRVSTANPGPTANLADSKGNRGNRNNHVNTVSRDIRVSNATRANSDIRVNRGYPTNKPNRVRKLLIPTRSPSLTATILATVLATPLATACVLQVNPGSVRAASMADARVVMEVPGPRASVARVRRTGRGKVRSRIARRQTGKIVGKEMDKVVGRIVDKARDRARRDSAWISTISSR